MKASPNTTVVGFVNRNQQVNLGLDNPNGTDHCQSVYALRCDRVLQDGNKCGHLYGANGSDIHGGFAPSARTENPACRWCEITSDQRGLTRIKIRQPSPAPESRGTVTSGCRLFRYSEKGAGAHKSLASKYCMLDLHGLIYKWMVR